MGIHLPPPLSEILQTYFYQAILRYFHYFKYIILNFLLYREYSASAL